MTTNENLIDVPGRLHSIAMEGHVAGADEIFDDAKRALQSDINESVDRRINSIEEEIGGGGGGTGNSLSERVTTLESNVSDINTDIGNDNTSGSVKGRIKAIEDSVGANGGIAELDNNGKVPSSQLPSMNYVPNSEKGANGGVATLDNSGKVPSSQLPGYVDDVIDLLDIAETAPEHCAEGDKYYNSTSKKIFTATGTDTWGGTGAYPESGKIYITLDDNKEYRWSGTTMAEISESLALGETASTAFAGNRGVAIEGKIPSAASPSNQLVDSASMQEAVSGKANASDVNTALAGKQNIISDLAVIRSGAALGETAQQPATTLAGYGIIDAYTKSEVDALAGTPVQNYVTVTATAQTTTVESLLPATGSSDTLYTVGCWDGTQYDAGKYSDYKWNGSSYVMIATHAYPGVDDTPTKGSQKLISSGGVYSSIAEEKIFYDSDSDDDLDISDNEGNVLVSFKDGHIRTKNFDSRDFAYLNLYGKNVLFFGDSITYYKEYVNAFSSKTGCTPYNRGLGSSCISNGGTGVPVSFCIRVDATPDNRQDGAGMAIGMPNNVDIDIVIIEGGINDFGYTNSGNKAAFLGDIGVADSPEIRQSFYGGIKYVISRIKTLYPNALVCVLGLIPTYSTSTFKNWSMVTLSDESNILSTLAKKKTSEDKSWFDYNEALEVTAKQFGALFISLENLGMNPLIESDRIKYYKDGLHPNNAGGELIANKIINSIKNLNA